METKSELNSEPTLEEIISELPEAAREKIKKAFAEESRLLSIKGCNLGTLSFASLESFLLYINKEFPDLEGMDLSDNALTLLPESIGSLKNLKYLMLSDNAFTLLPEPIGLLQNLKILNVRNNVITQLPGFIVNLNNLETIHLQNTSIKELPEEIMRCKSLTTIYLTMNGSTKPIYVPPKLLNQRKFRIEWPNSTVCDRNGIHILATDLVNWDNHNSYKTTFTNLFQLNGLFDFVLRTNNSIRLFFLASDSSLATTTGLFKFMPKEIFYHILSYFAPSIAEIQEKTKNFPETLRPLVDAVIKWVKTLDPSDGRFFEALLAGMKGSKNLIVTLLQVDEWLDKNPKSISPSAPAIEAKQEMPNNNNVAVQSQNLGTQEGVNTTGWAHRTSKNEVSFIPTSWKLPDGCGPLIRQHTAYSPDIKWEILKEKLEAIDKPIAELKKSGIVPSKTEESKELIENIKFLLLDLPKPIAMAVMGLTLENAISTSGKSFEHFQCKPLLEKWISETENSATMTIEKLFDSLKNILKTPLETYLQQGSETKFVRSNAEDMLNNTLPATIKGVLMDIKSTLDLQVKQESKGQAAPNF
jgi:hypothetical protein